MTELNEELVDENNDLEYVFSKNANDLDDEDDDDLEEGLDDTRGDLETQNTPKSTIVKKSDKADAKLGKRKKKGRVELEFEDYDEGELEAMEDTVRN